MRLLNPMLPLFSFHTTKAKQSVIFNKRSNNIDKINLHISDIIISKNFEFDPIINVKLKHMPQILNTNCSLQSSIPDQLKFH